MEMPSSTHCNNFLALSPNGTLVATMIDLAQKVSPDYISGTILGSQIALFFLWVLVLLVVFLTLRYFYKERVRQTK